MSLRIAMLFVCLLIWTPSVAGPMAFGILFLPLGGSCNRAAPQSKQRSA
jgi:hypothetical protein